MPWTSAGRSYWEVFCEINSNQKTLKIYTSWAHWEKQCRSTKREHLLLWIKHKYYFADVFVKNIFNLFHAYDLFLHSLKYIERMRTKEWEHHGKFLAGTCYLLKHWLSFRKQPVLEEQSLNFARIFQISSDLLL